MAYSKTVVTKISDIDVNKLSVGPVVQSKNGMSNTVTLLYNNIPLKVNIPALLTEYGVSKYTDSLTNKTSYSMNMVLDNSVETTVFKNKILEIEAKLVDLLVPISSQFIGKGKKLTEKIIAGKMNSGIKNSLSDTKKLNPYFNSKITNFDKEGKIFWGVEVYNKDKIKIFPSPEYETPVDCIPKKSLVYCVLDGSSVWGLAGKCGISWKLKQVAVGLIKGLPMDRCMVEFDPEEFNIA